MSCGNDPIGVDEHGATVVNLNFTFSIKIITTSTIFLLLEVLTYT